MAAPTTQVRHIVMDLGLTTDPNMHRAQKWSIQSADRSRAIVGGAGQDFCKDWQRRESIYVLWTANEKYFGEQKRGGNGEDDLVGALLDTSNKNPSTKEQSSTELPFALFRAQL